MKTKTQRKTARKALKAGREVPKPSETEAALAVVRAWLAAAGFHEDPDSEDPGRIELGLSDIGAKRERFVNVRFYVPALDIDHVIDGTHPDGITAETP